MSKWPRLFTRGKLLKDTSLSRVSRRLFRLTTVRVRLVCGANSTDIGRAVRAVNGDNVTKVAVCAGNGRARDGDDVGNRRRARNVAARSAGAVELAEVVDGEAIDYDFSFGVVLWLLVFAFWPRISGGRAVYLDHLVLGALSTTADDVVWTAALLQRKCVLTDLLPPDVFNSACTETVHTLNLVGTDDGIAKGSTLVDDEDSVRLTTLVLAGTFNTTTEGLQLTIVSLARANLVRLVEGHAAGGIRNGECESLPKLGSGQRRGCQEGKKEL